MPTNKAAIDKLLEVAQAYVGHSVIITESISRSRDIGGHNRHFATQSSFRMLVKRIDTFLSGAQLQFNGGEYAWYGIALDCVVSVDDQNLGALEIIERFETKMERKTTIQIVPSNDHSGQRLSAT